MSCLESLAWTHSSLAFNEEVPSDFVFLFTPSILKPNLFEVYVVAFLHVLVNY